jgi:poly-gamma-glutamate capsule biosynthesis protein CapA/YwtB (metallophosphatase superfamily)
VSAGDVTGFSRGNTAAIVSVWLACLPGCGTAVQQITPATDAYPVQPAKAPRTMVQNSAAGRAADLACARITIAATGDIMLGTDFPKNHLPDDDAISFLADVTPVLSNADIAFGNLEGVLMDGGEPVKKCKNPDACYLFRSPTRYADRLAAAGYDVMSLANNHARDFGEAGRSSSMQALETRGIRHSGRAGDIAIWADVDFKAALIAFAPFKESNPMLDPDEAIALVQALAEEHDLVIVSMHGGGEGADAAHVPFATEFYYGENRGNVVDFSRRMIDAGADLIIGHGPHVPRAMEIYGDRLIAYSLGNFATYYGISVTGDKSLAPVLVATVDGGGRFIRGEIVSAIQIRPGGPQLDPRDRAYERIRELTERDFPGGGLGFGNGGTLFRLAELPDQCLQIPAGPEF